MFRMVLSAGLLTAAVVAPGAARAESPSRILGIVEKAVLLPENIALDAKVDTGADNSSVDVESWELVEIDGRRMVRFVLRGDNGSRREMTRELVRMATIRRAGAHHERPVVRMEVCVGDVVRTVDVNLGQRPRMSYRMLLGASFLEGAFLVDVGAAYVAPPRCTAKD